MLTEMDHGEFTVIVIAEIGPFGGKVTGRKKITIRK